MQIEIPWPNAKLSPNSNTHYRVLAIAKAKYKEECLAMLRTQAKPDFILTGNVALDMTFHPPKNYRYDMDGILSRCKVGLDTVAKWLGVDDYCFEPITIRRGEKVLGGKIVISIDCALGV